MWNEGTTYSTTVFLTPVSFSPTEPGWRSYGAGDSWVHATWLSSPDLSVSLTLVAYRASDPVEVVLEAIVDIDGVDALTTPSATTIGGRPALSMDVSGAAADNAYAMERFACSYDAGKLFPQDPGYPLVSPSGMQEAYGIAACGVARVWVVDVDGVSITVLGSTLDVDSFDDLIRPVEDLLATIDFAGS